MHIDDYSFSDDGLDVSSLIPDDDDFSIDGDDDSLIDEAVSEYHQGKYHPTFEAKDTLPHNANADGYIPDGKQELTSTISNSHKTFNLYTKDGHDYVLYNGRYYRIDGVGTVTIGGIKYNKI